MIQIGNVTIKDKIILSPMAGISDSPYRQICREMGSGLSFTEFVSTDAISHNSKKSIDMFRYQEMERPIIFQIFGNKIDVITEAAKIIAELKPDIIDLNMGCSVSKVAHKGSGAGLLKNLPYAGKIIESLRKAVDVPVTAKIRIGWDLNSLNYKETVKVLQESGVCAISVHGRTKSMAYSGVANWNVIAEIKSMASVPIFGNGDIQSHEEAIQKMKETNVDGVLIGRAAIGNPWIFSNVKREGLDFSEIKRIILRHLDLMVNFYGEKFGIILFRKHVAKYLKGFYGVSELKNNLMQVTTYEDFVRTINEYSP
ncbi:MAG: tRNA dihydrouridine synthase DusB [Leptospiraceae bacterium]|nr:tRNA dihydrouridine synthase DusB [Leptospiraceae bacterium]MCP5496264.1 tRNA dihydrouridine synthase DusB [Leptospiraceae bacterium]